ncbi:aspartyl protease family protein [Roseibium hamelinense]|uniref:Aspartyl protease family protein n=1 Tax=Roseibium hamelinense TaxID=150831 RepID=A0A562SHL2_9HYPH|nr:TIGR02281 family clan AA aspartic protease [Roseibium hamelinense]MTI43930.1 TIGR02281 family clan AA aspartic protease [Roseibium hamelinense]TWI80775.1 aspartyl protease family protein [Roseibium hamelinense]
MFRILIIAVLIAAVAPLVPYYFEKYRTAPTPAASTNELKAAQEPTVSGRRFEIAKAVNGQYMTEAELNGRFVTMLVDTGASTLALPEKVARRAGIFVQPSDFKQPVNTANGVTYAASVTVRDLKIGPIRLKNVEAMVLKDDRLGVPLLGMSALGRLEGFDISDDTLVLVQ